MDRFVRKMVRLATLGSAVLFAAVIVLSIVAKHWPLNSASRSITQNNAVVVEKDDAIVWDGYGLGIDKSEAHFLRGQTYDDQFQLVGIPTATDVQNATYLAANLKSTPYSPDVRATSFRYSRDAALHRSDGAQASADSLYQRSLELRVPFFDVAILAAILPAFFACRWWVRRRAENLKLIHFACRQCGYDMRETLDRCPECGTVPPWRSRRRRSPESESPTASSSNT